MLKVAIRGGHNHQATGASALVSEIVENRKILSSTIKYLKMGGAEVLDVTPGNMSTSQDLAYGVNKANAWGADVFASIHLNKAYTSYVGAIGTEVLVYSPNDYAQRVVNNIAKLGFENRGQKIKPEFYEPRNTNSKCLIIETFFCEATEDVVLYKRIGADAIGKAIAEGILNKKINSNNNNDKSEDDEEMAIKDIFVEGYYLDNNQDVKAEVKKGIISVKEHYEKYGKTEGRKPNIGIPKGWSESGYLMNNPDVDKNISSGEGYRNGLEHYLLNGYREGRSWEYKHTCKIEETDKNLGEKFYRVCTGSYKQVENARAEKETLKKKGINDAFVVEYYKK